MLGQSTGESCHIRRGGICLRRPFETIRTVHVILGVVECLRRPFERIWNVKRKRMCKTLWQGIILHRFARIVLAFVFCVVLRSVFQNRQFWNGGSLYPRNRGLQPSCRPACFLFCCHESECCARWHKAWQNCGCMRMLERFTGTFFLSLTDVRSASALRRNGFCTVGDWSLVCSSSLEPLDSESTNKALGLVPF